MVQLVVIIDSKRSIFDLIYNADNATDGNKINMYFLNPISTTIPNAQSEEL